MQHPMRWMMTRSLTILVIATLVLSTATGSVAAHAADGESDWGWDHMWDDGHMDGWGWGVWGGGMLLFGLVWIVLLIGLPVVLVYWVTTQGQSRENGSDRALELLRERYARGELSEEEFETRRARLS